MPIPHTTRVHVDWPNGAPACQPLGLQKIDCRCEHVGNAVPEIDVPVAIIVDPIFHARGWRKLRLADIARLGTGQVSQVKSALDDL